MRLSLTRISPKRTDIRGAQTGRRVPSPLPRTPATFVPQGGARPLEAYGTRALGTLTAKTNKTCHTPVARFLTVVLNSPLPVPTASAEILRNLARNGASF